MANQDGQWVTINGRHILLKDGQTKDDLIKSLISKKKESIKKQTEEDLVDKKEREIKEQQERTRKLNMEHKIYDKEVSVSFAPKNEIFNKGAIENGHYIIPEGYKVVLVSNDEAFQASMDKYNKTVARLKAQGETIFPPKPYKGLYGHGGWVKLVKE